VVLITNSKVKHSLSDSEYPVRVQQCREAVDAIARAAAEAAAAGGERVKVKALRDVTEEMLEAAKTSMSSIAYMRAHHCVTEDKRTLKVCVKD
jgi:galactokinase